MEAGLSSMRELTDSLPVGMIIYSITGVILRTPNLILCWQYYFEIGSFAFFASDMKLPAMTLGDDII